MDEFFEIKSFSGGLNEYVAEGLLEPNECVNISNCNIDNGSLNFSKEGTFKLFITFYVVTS